MQCRLYYCSTFFYVSISIMSYNYQTNLQVELVILVLNSLLYTAVPHYQFYKHTNTLYFTRCLSSFNLISKSSYRYLLYVLVSSLHLNFNLLSFQLQQQLNSLNITQCAFQLSCKAREKLLERFRAKAPLFLETLACLTTTMKRNIEWDQDAAFRFSRQSKYVLQW